MVTFGNAIRTSVNSTQLGNNILSQWIGSRDNHGSSDHFDIMIDKAGGEVGRRVTISTPFSFQLRPETARGHLPRRYCKQPNDKERRLSGESGARISTGQD
jgi:hypothetical protein